MSGYTVRTQTRVLSFPVADHAGCDPGSGSLVLTVDRPVTSESLEPVEDLLICFAPGEWTAFWPTESDIPATLWAP